MKMNCFKRIALALVLLATAASYVSCIDAGDSYNVGGNDIYTSGPELGSGEWNGIYKWVNPTNKTNKGKCTEIVFEVREVELEDGEPAFEVWDLSEPTKPRRMFPIEIMPEGGFQWHDWNEDSTVADNYRANAGKFNTTSAKPSKWRVKTLVRNDRSGSCAVETTATFIFTITVNTKNHFNLRYNSSQGRMELAFIMDGDGLASTGLFYNPAPSEEGKKVFPLVKQ